VRSTRKPKVSLLFNWLLFAFSASQNSLEQYETKLIRIIPAPEMSGGRSQGGNVVEEHREEIIDIPAANGRPEIIEKRTYDSRRELSPPRSRIGRSRSVGPAPVIVDAREPYEVVDRTSYAPAGPLVLLGNRDSRDSRAVKAEIKALEYEREAMKAEAKAQLELRRAEKIREYGRNGELVMYDELKVKRDRLDPDVIIKVKREKEPDEGVTIRKEAKKGMMTLSQLKR